MMHAKNDVYEYIKREDIKYINKRTVFEFINENNPSEVPNFSSRTSFIQSK